MNSVPIPFPLSELPRDHRGLPITFSSLKLPDGTVDFTTSDPRKWAMAAQCRLCGLCGTSLPRLVYFIGGPKSYVNRYYFDLPMHEACARYSLAVCPYLSMPKYLGAKSRPTPDWARQQLASSDKTKPLFHILSKTSGYEIKTFQGDVLVFAKPWLGRPEYWLDGKQITQQEAEGLVKRG